MNDPDDPPFLGMARESLHEVMAGEVDRLGVPVHLGVTVARTGEPDDDGLEVELTDGRVGRFQYVVGADGVNSATRTEASSRGPTSPQFAGQMIWRMLALEKPGRARAVHDDARRPDPTRSGAAA